MFDAAPFTHIPVIAEPTPEAHYREELANEREASETEALTALPVDIELIRAGHLARLGRLVRFG